MLVLEFAHYIILYGIFVRGHITDNFRIPIVKLKVHFEPKNKAFI